ncbi:hypothetical protein GF312_07370 [Candidatus Poribacteria bacterium]|nr:hypothetical protein [Candidatus Poribacteria bacterium]
MQSKSSGSVQFYYPQFSRKEIIQKLKDNIKFLEKKLPLSLIVLFGSYAKDNYTAASDIDLMVIYKGQEIKNAFEIVKKTIPIPRLEPHVYSENNYTKLEDTIQSMIRDGVVLYDKKS